VETERSGVPDGRCRCGLLGLRLGGRWIIRQLCRNLGGQPLGFERNLQTGQPITEGVIGGDLRQEIILQTEVPSNGGQATTDRLGLDGSVEQAGDVFEQLEAFLPRRGLRVVPDERPLLAVD